MSTEKDSAALSKIPPLQAGSFHRWSGRLSIYLSARRMGDYIRKDKVDLIVAEESAVEYEVKNAKALEAILSTIDIHSENVIAGITTAREAFLALEKHHGQNTGLATHELLITLLNLRMKLNDKLSAHITTFRNLHNRLAVIAGSDSDFKIPDPVIATILLNSLGNQYQQLVDTLFTEQNKLSTIHVYDDELQDL